ncbi:GNAT family N-acetyltransferase [Priestia filamentosa]|uniref:GNAT family N-acetyltransferase n=1 Tax=Priestia filamentosa TaxID=1402861 RepID=UPI000588EB35
MQKQKTKTLLESIKVEKMLHEPKQEEFILQNHYEFVEGDSKNFLIKLNNEVIGFLQFAPYDQLEFINGYGLEEYIVNGLGDQNAIELKKIFIHSEYQCKGIGTMLTNWIKKNVHGRRIVLYALAEAEDFWIKQGFSLHEFPLKEDPTDIYTDYVYYYN